LTLACKSAILLIIQNDGLSLNVNFGAINLEGTLQDTHYGSLTYIISTRTTISGLLTSVGKTSREVLISKEPTIIVEKLSVNYDTSVVLNF